MTGTGIRFANATVTRLRATASADRYGDQVFSWASPDELVVTGCWLQPAAAGPENVVDRDEVTRRWLLGAPPDADILATDRIRWAGDDFEVSGAPRRWGSPSGRLAHLEIDLQRVEG
jgi:hypothetical protein